MEAPNDIKRVVKKILPESIRKKLKYIKSRYFTIVHKHIVGKNNRIICNRGGVTLNNVTFDIIGSSNIIQIEEGASIKNVSITIRGNNNKCIFNKNTQIRDGGAVFAFGHNTCFEIGENTGIGNAVFAVLEDNSKIIIGKDCMLSNNIDIRTSDSHPIFDKNTGERINFAKDVIINDHVWISANCKILKGVIISKDSIIGFSSVVTKSFDESNVSIAGVPAKIVKRNITWGKEHCPPMNILDGDFEYEK